MSAVAMTVRDLKEALAKLPDFYEVHLQTGDTSLEALHLGDVGTAPIANTTTYQGHHWLVLLPSEDVDERCYSATDLDAHP
jgi:hypothetical protein